MMKKSIRRQITTIFIALIGALILIELFMNGFFLETFYVKNKRSGLHQAYNQMNDAASDGSLTSDETADKLSRLAEVGNISFVVIADNNQEIIGASSGTFRTRELFARLMGYIFEQNQADGELLESADNYQIRMARDEISEREYVEMWGYLDNGNAFILRSPLDSIRESVDLSNRFFVFTALTIACVGSLLIWYFARRITNPIRELTDLSVKMANLDFEAKYKSGGENEIGVLGRNFNTMSEKLEQTISELKNANYELRKDIENKEKAESMLTEFIGNVSHELKTPIALIQGYAEGLKEGIAGDPENMKFYCDVIADEADKMNQLVKNLLALNQLEYGRDEIDYERFDLMEVIRGVLQSSRIMIEQKKAKVRLRAPEHVFVWADEFRVEQVVRNYLGNAFNHVDGERIIDIKVEPGELSGKVRVTVFNTGERIPEEDIGRIWDKFYKVDKSRAREYGGHGIGLSIVKAIMEALGQGYGAENYGNGVAFWFELDLK